MIKRLTKTRFIILFFITLFIMFVIILMFKSNDIPNPTILNVMSYLEKGNDLISASFEHTSSKSDACRTFKLENGKHSKLGESNFRFTLGWKRSFKGKRLFKNYVNRKKDETKVDGCSHWIVYGPEHITNKAVRGFKYIAEKENSIWCVVSVLHKHSIEAEYDLLKSDRFVVLTLGEQPSLLKTSLGKGELSVGDNFTLGTNLGYLYAITHGAKFIYDTKETSRFDNPSIPSFEEIRDYVLVSKEGNLITSYKEFLTLAPEGLWRLGFFHPATSEVGEFHFLKKKDYGCIDFDRTNVRVVGFVEKEVSSLERKEMGETRLHMAVYRGTYTKYDSSSLLNDYTAFFGLFKPVCMEDELADILRSFYSQRLMCDLGFNVAFSERTVIPTNDNVNSKLSVKMQKGLVQFILSWGSKALSLVERMEELAIAFYEKGYWEKDQVTSVQAWVTGLISAGYTFPKIPKSEVCKSTQVKECVSEKKQEHPPDFNGPKEPSKGVGKVDYFLRMTAGEVFGPRLVPYYDRVFAWTLKFFWQDNANPMDLILVLDDDMKEDHEFGERKRKEYPFPRVYYEVDRHCYGTDKKNRMQWSMHWADAYTDKAYVGFVDTDSMYNSLVSEEMFFDGDKPRVFATFGTSDDEWSTHAKRATYDYLHIRQTVKAMTYFPVIIKTKHLIEIRDYLENIHGSGFDELFNKVASHIIISQYNVMMNYVWYFHREEYAWHLEESQFVNDLDSPEALVEFPEITEEMKFPFPKLIIHFKYIRYSVNVAEDWDFLDWTPNRASMKTRNKLMLEGYCFSGGFSLTPEKCTDFDKNSVRVSLFDWEHHSWLWDDRCLAAQREHYASTSSLVHKWDLDMLNDLPTDE